MSKIHFTPFRKAHFNLKYVLNRSNQAHDGIFDAEDSHSKISNMVNYNRLIFWSDDFLIVFKLIKKACINSSIGVRKAFFVVNNL